MDGPFTLLLYAFVLQRKFFSLINVNSISMYHSTKYYLHFLENPTPSDKPLDLDYYRWDGVFPHLKMTNESKVFFHFPPNHTTLEKINSRYNKEIMCIS